MRKGDSRSVRPTGTAIGEELLGSTSIAVRLRAPCNRSEFLMAKTKVRRVRISTRLSVELRAQLTKYCAASGISERMVIEDALSKHLHNTDDMALIARRLDGIVRELAHDHRDLELLSEAFGRYMRLWFMAHAPSTAEAGKGATRGAGETQYRQFAQHLGAQFKQGHRFVHDVPVEAFGDEDDSP
jgi:hypothetical protein